MTTGVISVSSSIARPRKLHRGHFAFLRAVVQGVDTRASWDRYLAVEGEHTDARLVKKRSCGCAKNWRWPVAGRAARAPGASCASMWRPSPTRSPRCQASRTSPPRAEGFSQAEITEFYAERYGSAAPQASRRARLMAKQLAALRWLEDQVAVAPHAGDALAAWLNPAIAGYLETAGIVQIRDLIDRINGIGRHWHRSVAAIGTAKAARIVAWLKDHQASIGLKIGAHAGVGRSKLDARELNAVVAPATAIRPLEKFLVPAELDGSNGLYRAPQRQCLMKATNDYQAIQVWLSVSRSAHTTRAYRKEAERFLLWAVIDRKKALSSMTLEDCLAYQKFLADPQPATSWCGMRNRNRWGPMWRPFEGPLTAASERQAITILKAMYEFFVSQAYLIGNPFNGVLPLRRKAPLVNAGRSFTQSQWAFAQSQLAQREPSGTNERLRFALHFLYQTGVRLSEAVQAKVGDLQWVEFPAEKGDDTPIEGWMLTVIGKGQKVRTVPVSIELVAKLAAYLQVRGLDPDPEHPSNQAVHILGKGHDQVGTLPWTATSDTIPDAADGIAASTLYGQLKAFFTECGKVLSRTDPKGGAAFARASTHWLRHTHGSHSVAAGTELDVLQQNLGHASLATATIYSTAEDRRRIKGMRGFWGRK